MKSFSNNLNSEADKKQVTCSLHKAPFLKPLFSLENYFLSRDCIILGQHTVAFSYGGSYFDLSSYRKLGLKAQKV